MRHTVQRAGKAVVAGAVLGALVAMAPVATPEVMAQGQAKELSEKSVITLMNYAWSILPSKFTSPNGKTIEVDKTKRDALIPVEAGREVIKIGNVSAQAQLCDLMEDQVANYNALMARELAKKSWTDQQLLYITTLHRMTIHMGAGKVRIVEKGADEVQVMLEPIEPSKDSCNDDKKQKVKEAILAYVKASPAPVAPVQQQGAAPSPAPVAAPAAQPVPAAAKDQKK